MRIAITGGTGFIGRRLATAHLERGDQVRLLSRRSDDDLSKKALIFRADLTDPLVDLLPFVDGVDVLYHCAGQSTDKSRMHAVHVEGTQKLVNVAYGRVNRWVQLSSVGVYGPHRVGVVTENTPEAPVGIYEKTKAASDSLVTAAAHAGAFECVTLRPSIVYGPGMPNQSLYRLIDVIARGLFFFIGPPGAVVNYAHVNGVAAALLACGIRTEAHGRTYIVSDNRPLDVVVASIAIALGRPVPRLHLPLGPVLLAARVLGCIPGFPLSESRVQALTSRIVYDGGRIERELGYRHPVSLEQGFCELVENWRKRW